MVILNALYSDTGLFDRITFKAGINIIKGKYSRRGGGDVNGIGKSSVVRLIDYVLLSTGFKKLFNQDKYEFLEGHSLSLEFFIHEEPFTIKRFFRDKNSRVYFGKEQGNLTEYSESELKNILGTKFFLQEEYNGVINADWFRNLMRFYIKDDINHHQRLKPENFINPGLSVKNAQLVYHNLFLFDLPNKNVFDFDRFNDEVNEKRKIKKNLEERFQYETGKTVDQYNYDKYQIENRIQLLEKSTSEFKFLENYTDIENQLVELSATISGKLYLMGRLKKEFKNYENSYKLEFDADIEKVNRIYSELDRKVGELVKNTLENVIRFRRDISENRRKFLRARQAELTQSIDHVMEEISALETRRAKLYKFLEEKKALDGLKHSYQQLIEEKATLARNDIYIKEINELTLSISEASEKISNTITSIIKDIQGSRDQIRDIRALFFDILKNAVMVDENTEGALFEIKESESRKAPCQIRVDIPRSEALGKSRFRILVYDLTIFLNQIKHQKQLPRFLIHDGVFHAIAAPTVVNTLNYLASQTLTFPNFQYIITANENELHLDGKYGEYQFDPGACIIAEFEDIREKMLFKEDF